MVLINLTTMESLILILQLMELFPCQGKEFINLLFNWFYSRNWGHLRSKYCSLVIVCCEGYYKQIIIFRCSTMKPTSGSVHSLPSAGFGSCAVPPGPNITLLPHPPASVSQDLGLGERDVSHIIHD